MANFPTSPWPVPITSLSRASAGTVVWRREGRLMLTVIVKATIKLIVGGTAELLDPAPVFSAETSGPGDVVFCRDDAPALQRADVTAWGMTASSAASDAALVVGLGHERLLVKQTRASGPTIRCFAPLLLADRPLAKSPAGLPTTAHDIVELGDALDWSQLQNAPADQQLASLRGDEWIATRGIHPEYSDISTRLPAQYAMARLYGGDALPRVPLPLRLDSVHLVMHQLTGSLVWRAHWPLLTDAIPPDLEVAAGIAPFGQILELGDLPPADIIEEPTDDPGVDPWAEMRRTRAVTDDDLASMAAALPTFMASDAPQLSEDTFIYNVEAMETFRQTRSLTRETQADLEQAFREAAPFALADKPVASPRADIPGAPWSGAAAPASAPHAFADVTDTISEIRPAAQEALALGAQEAGQQHNPRGTAHWFPAIGSQTAAPAAPVPAPRPPPPPRRNSPPASAAVPPPSAPAASGPGAPPASQQEQAASQQEQAARAAQQQEAEAKARAEAEARQRRADELKAEEQARAQAARDAEERRVQQAKRFEEEQRLAREREAERQRKERDEKREKARNLRSSLYSGMKRRD